MATRTFAFCAALTATAAALPAGADETYDDRIYVMPMLSYVIADDVRHAENRMGAALALGMRVTPWLEAELRGQYLDFKGEGQITNPICSLLGTCPDAPDVDFTSGGGGINLFPDPSGGFYLHGDVMGGDATYYNAGIGYEFKGVDSSLRVEALYHMDDDADVEEPQFNVGWRIPLGARPPAPTPEPVRIVPVIPMPTPAPTPVPSCESPADAGAGSMDGCGPGDQFVLRGVNFEFDKANLTANAKTILDPVAAELVARPSIDIEIQGHTDSKGSDAYNQKLSEARASSVVSYLGDKGVASERMDATGYGESMPIADNATDEGREQNRRVELKVVNDPSGAAVMPTPTPEPAAFAPAAAVVTPAETPVAVATPEPTPAAAPGTAAVSIGNMVFEPATLRIAAGTTVTWTNNDGSNHNVTFPTAASVRMRHGATYVRRFDTPGTYDYLCAIHGAMMSGTVIVE
jgi:outer membrane protein OmpA-like peptidoglycan-associated protein/plastocyanin